MSVRGCASQVRVAELPLLELGSCGLPALPLILAIFAMPRLIDTSETDHTS